VDSVIAHYRNLLLKLLESPKIPFDANLRRTLPSKSGIYRVFEIGSEWYQSVYFGKTGNLQNRVYGDLLMGNLPRHTLKRKLIGTGEFADKAAAKQYLKGKCFVQVLPIGDDHERTLFEHFAIAILRPMSND
jgi:hypothetical protein